MKLMQHLAAGNPPLTKIEGLTTSATAGTRTPVTHGFQNHIGNPVVPEVVIAQVEAADADGTIAAAAVFVVGVDADEVIVRGSAASVPFSLYIG